MKASSQSHMAEGARDATWLQVNCQWLEALDPGSGRVYFVELPTQQSSWDAPDGFMCAVLAQINFPNPA